jgi:hypothetical protein
MYIIINVYYNYELGTRVENGDHARATTCHDVRCQEVQHDIKLYQLPGIYCVTSTRVCVVLSLLVVVLVVFVIYVEEGYSKSFVSALILISL